MQTSISRRHFLQAAALLAACIPTTGCEPMLSQLTNYMGLGLPEKVGPTNSAEIDPAFHLLSRAAYGPWPGEVDQVRQKGIKAWIEEQTNPESINDEICDLRSRRFESLLLPVGECYEFKQEVIRRDLVRHAVLKAVYSKRQLFEVMVGFWTDHLNIDIGKGDCIYLKPLDDAQVIRKHALGKFKDLIRDSAISPAMLVYLDGAENKKALPTDVPNENYARELLELHTLGVNGGYTQKDVFEAARCLTGWTLGKEGSRGQQHFDINLHDQGEKIVLGRRIAAGGSESDLDRLIDIVTSHPSTATYIASKLCTRFISDAPPVAVIEEAARTFTSSDGSIKETVKTILLSQQFSASKGSKIKRPFHYIVSTLRQLGADTHAHDPLVDYLLRMGQGPYQYPTPDGYPDEAAPWLGTLLWRWNFAFDVSSGQLPSVEIALSDLGTSIGMKPDQDWQPVTLFQYLIGRAPSSAEIKVLNQFAQSHSPSIEENRNALLGLIISSPAYLRC